VLGTTGFYLPKGRIKAGNTTPGPLELQQLLRRAKDEGCQSVAMEVSSHALDQQRTEGVAFDAAVFTNLTRDHLDYHGSMAAYGKAKALLFASLARSGKPALGVVNGEDAAWKRMAKAMPKQGRLLRYGTQAGCDVRAAKIRARATETRFTLHVPGQAGIETFFPMPGDFNLMNALAAAAVGAGLGLSAKAIAAALEKPVLPPGRFQRVDAGQRFSVIVDYAHTPDAMARALKAARAFTQGRLIAVFGCGGDRDRGKRPQMGLLGYRMADLVVLTSDNPRSEDPQTILKEIRAGIPESRGMVRRVLELEDRRAAIRRAIKVARPGDTVMILGKGHETSQHSGDQILPFDDAQVARESILEMKR
jgi:UDP-N-acetylmuramoyl-L-alanyl-D-glutamate--2,6-diaminopimelate ligase